MEVNILITSVSRKVWLIEALREAFTEEGVDGRIISVDVDPLSAGLYLSDRQYLVPYSSEQNFIPEVLNICRKENIALLLPTRDEELLIFAKNKEKFKELGTEVLVSDAEIIEICSDKCKFYKFMKENNISTPETILPDQLDSSSLSYPLIVKSRTGSGSKGVFKVMDSEELRFFSRYVPNPIIQEFVQGKEYTVDLFSDFSKKILSAVPRERIETVSGESYKGKTVKDEHIIASAIDVADKLKTVGNISLQFIKNKDSLKVIEVNSRFGGASILSIKAGHNTPLWLIKLICGKTIEQRIGEFEEDLVMLRYPKGLFISRNEVVGHDKSHNF